MIVNNEFYGMAGISSLSPHTGAAIVTETVLSVGSAINDSSGRQCPSCWHK